MLPYSLAIFDFDGTLVDSADWFRSELPGLLARHHLAPVESAELDTLRALPAREIMARLGVPIWKLPAIMREMRKRKLDAACQLSLFDRVPDMFVQLYENDVRIAIVSSDSERSVRQTLGKASTFVSSFECGASIFGKARKFKRVAKSLHVSPTRTICIGDELRDIDAAKEAGMDAGAVAWGYALPEALMAAKPKHMFASIEAMGEALSASS